MEYCDGKTLWLQHLGGDLSNFIEKHGGKKKNKRIYLNIFEQLVEGLNVIHA